MSTCLWKTPPSVSEPLVTLAAVLCVLHSVSGGGVEPCYQHRHLGLLSTQAFGPTPNGPCLCGMSPVGLSPYNCQGASWSLMGSMLEGRDVRFSRLRPCPPHLPHVWRWAYFFLVEVKLELDILLQGGIRELGAQLLSIALPHTRWYLRQEHLEGT